jgi:hypothetical protein
MGFASWEYGIGVRACGDCVSCFEEILSGCTAYEQRCLVRIAGRIAPGTNVSSDAWIRRAISFFA